MTGIVNRNKMILTLLCLSAFTLSGCSQKTADAEAGTEMAVQGEDSGLDAGVGEIADLGDAGQEMVQTYVPPMDLAPAEQNDKYRTTYEVFVGSFCDSDGDGIGDLPGLVSKLDYINDGDPFSGDDLGCTQLWTTPVFPSPTYHKYDAVDYRSIDPAFGSLEDMDALIQACHARGMTYIMDLALNHTSVDHPWFQAAADYLRQLPEDAEADPAQCPYVDYYHFSRQAADGYAPLTGTDWYYEARFWEGMPDLNLDSEKVRDEILQILNFWQGRGVDGFRLDAVLYYYTDDQDKNISFLSWLNDAVKANNPDACLVGEAWASSSTYLPYYQSGVDSFFDFDYAGQEGIIASVIKGSHAPSFYEETIRGEEEALKGIDPQAIMAPFYTNHDMARSAGYYAYDKGGKTKLAQAMNLLMPGNAFLYYGEELGMKGAGADENKRAPMQWSDDPKGEGMCSGPEGMEMPKMKFGSLESQAQREDSIYEYLRRVIRIREACPVIARGQTSPVEELEALGLCAFTRTDPRGEMEDLMILINPGEDPVTVQESELGEYGQILTFLAAGEENCQRKKDTLIIPGYGILVMRKS